MKRHWMPIPLTAAMLLLSPGALNPAGASAAPQRLALSSIVLHRGDVPSGFKLAQSRALNNTAAAAQAHFSLAVLRKHGRVGGYQTAFTQGSRAVTAYVISLATAYTSPTGAHWGFAQNVHSARAQNGMKIVPSAHVGDESTGLAVVQKTPAASLSTYAFTWRHGSYNLGTVVYGKTGTVSMAQCVHYAQVMDARIH